MPRAGPWNLVISFAVELSPQGSNERVRFCLRIDESRAIQISHGQVHHSAVTPETTGMKWKPVGQQPHFRRDRVVTLPLHAAQQTEPKLGPGTGHDGTAVVLDELAPPNADIAIGIGAQKTQGNVRNGRSKHSRGTFDVRAPPTVRLLMYREVVSHQRTLFGIEHGVRLAHHIPRNNEAGHQEVRSTIISSPMAVRALQHGVEVSCLPGRLRCRLGLVIYRGRGLPGCHIRTDHLSTKYLIATICVCGQD